jgi:hypothetical protein
VLKEVLPDCRGFERPDRPPRGGVGRFLSVATTPLQKPGLMPQALEHAADFLLDFARRRVDSEPFPDFSPPWREFFRSEFPRDLNDLPLLAANFACAMHFSLAYVTRVTYKTRTLHRCAEIDQPADGPPLRALLCLDPRCGRGAQPPDPNCQRAEGSSSELRHLTPPKGASLARCLSLGFGFDP